MKPLVLGVAMIAGSILLFVLSWKAIDIGTDAIWQGLSVVAVCMLFRGIWEIWQFDGWVACAVIVLLVMLGMGLMVLQNVERTAWDGTRVLDESLRVRAIVFLGIAGLAFSFATFRTWKLVRAMREEGS